MTPNKNVQRNTINEAAVRISDVPKSGFKLGFSSQLSGTIGKLLVTSAQFVMPGDRVSSGNSLRAQFEPLAVPMSGRLSLDSHNFYIRFRNIYGQDWMKFMNMSQGVSEVSSLPTFTLKGVMEYLATIDFPRIRSYSSTAWSDFVDEVDAWLTTGVLAITDFTTADWVDEYSKAVKAEMDATSAPTNEAEYLDAVKMILYLVLDKLLGEGSYLDFFGYPILDHRTVNKLVDQYGVTGTTAVVWADVVSDVPLLDCLPRSFYAVWFYYYRNIYTEPKAKCINPVSWTTTPLSYATLVKLLVPRFRNWNVDMFTGAQIDDISRHVYAGLTLSGGNSQSWAINTDYEDYTPADAGNIKEATAEGIVSQDLQFIDVDGNVKVQNIRVPSMFGSDFIAGNGTSLSAPGNLPLLQLRRAKMLERFLKRSYLGGDTYKDFLQSHFSVSVSEALVNQPEYLRGSSTACDVSMEVNNTTTAESPAGTKTAVMACDASGDGFQKFCDEHGVIINIISFLPECSYDAMPNQLIYSKLMDFPFPEFAQQDDELSHRFEIARTALKSEQAASLRPFAHHPYKHDWRGRVNDFHGNALSTRKMYNFGRLFDYSAEGTTPKMNASFLHCKPSLDMFISSSPLNDVWFGYADHEFYVERCLTAYVEEV